ncbi:MAG: ABC transporter ATP-binding protein, partial [Lachnospiraceae bacterium]|nr:ABC transporter ATP-binding protein [Lachnospiraceae bacterium]
MKDDKKKVNQKETLLKVLAYIRPYKFLMALTIIMAAVSVALTLYLPILTGDAVDLLIYIFDPSSLNVASPWPALFFILKKMAVVILLTAVTQWIMNICNNKIVYSIIQDIRKKAFRRLEELPLKYLDAHSHGDIVSRVVADVDQFADGLLIGFTQLFTGVITILGTLLFMLSVNVGITVVVVVITPVSLFVASFIAKKTFSMFKLQSETRGEQTALINEMIGNQKVVQAFNREDETLERFDEINGRLEKCSLRAIFFSSLTNPCTRFVNSLVYTGVGLTGAFAVLRGGLSVGQLTCFLSYANQYTKPFNEISGVITELQNALACAARIFELIEEEPQEPDAEDAMVLENAEGEVNLDHVSFSY